MAFEAPLGELLDETRGARVTPEVRHAVQAELEAICTDKQFRSSQRNCAFLRYVVTETLEGRATDIKERTLGVELFGRPASYDTGSDAVVRVRANEVRKRLACYYDEHKTQAGWRVQLPLRTYVPLFLQDAAPASIQPNPLPSMGSAIPPDRLAAPAKILPLSQMMIPTLIALFLCAATFRWQVFSGTPYLDFWEALLAGHSRIALVLDADSADPNAVTVNDLKVVNPLLQTAASFHAAAQVMSSGGTKANRSSDVPIYVTHHAISPHDLQAAYITVVPGPHPELWISSANPDALGLAITSLSSADIFPYALEIAIRRKVPSRLRFAEKQPVTMQAAGNGEHNWPP